MGGLAVRLSVFDLAFTPVRSLSRHALGEGRSFFVSYVGVTGQQDGINVQLAAMHRDPCGNFSNA